MECLFLTPLGIALVAGLAGLVAGFWLGRLSRGTGRRSGKIPGNPEGGSGNGIELYVGNLSYDMSDAALEKTFSSFGNVLSVRVIKNKFNDRSKGYGFIEMADQSGADKACKAMNGKDVMGRKMVVNEARSKSRD